MRIVQTLGTPWRTLEVCKWFSLLANLAMWTWAGAWIAGQKRPFASWMSRQEGVQTKAWPDKKGWFAKMSGQNTLNWAHLPNWFAPFVFLQFYKFTRNLNWWEGLGFHFFTFVSISFWKSLHPRNLFNQKCTGPHWVGHQVNRPARRKKQGRKRRNFKSNLFWFLQQQKIQTQFE